MRKDQTTTIKLETLNGPVIYKFKNIDITEYPELKTRSYNVMRENAMFTKRLLLMEHGKESITALIEGVLMYDVPNLNFNDNLEKLFSEIASCLEEHYDEDGKMDQPEPSIKEKTVNGYRYIYDAKGLLTTIQNGEFAFNRDDRENRGETWYIHKAESSATIGTLTFHKSTDVDKLGEGYYHVRVRIQYDHDVCIDVPNYLCASQSCTVKIGIPTETYVTNAIDHLLMKRKDLIKKQRKGKKMKATSTSQTEPTTQQDVEWFATIHGTNYSAMLDDREIIETDHHKAAQWEVIDHRRGDTNIGTIDMVYLPDQRKLMISYDSGESVDYLFQDVGDIPSLAEQESIIQWILNYIEKCRRQEDWVATWKKNIRTTIMEPIARIVTHNDKVVVTEKSEDLTYRCRVDVIDKTLDIHIDAISRNSTGEYEIEIKVSRREEDRRMYPNLRDPLVRTMTLIDRGRIPGYEFAIKRINNWSITAFGIPTIYVVEKASLNDSINNIVTHVDKLLKEKNEDILSMLGITE